jgi:hypothetical protein
MPHRRVVWYSPVLQHGHCSKVREEDGLAVSDRSRGESAPKGTKVDQVYHLGKPREIMKCILAFLGAQRNTVHLVLYLEQSVA